MQRWRISLVWLAAAGLSLVAFKGNNSSQPPVGRTGAPSEGTCRDCHSGGTGAVTITLEQVGGQPFTTYVPGGAAMNLRVAVSHSTASVYGFQLTALSSQAGQEDTPNQGLSTGGATNLSIQTGPGGRKYLNHFMASSTNSWIFTWTPPTTNVGPITWYIAANAANGNGNTSGDATGATSFTIQPDVSSALPIAEMRPFYLVGQTLYFHEPITAATLYTLEGRELLHWQAGQGPLLLSEKGGLYLLRLSTPTGESLHKILVPGR